MIPGTNSCLYMQLSRFYKGNLCIFIIQPSLEGPHVILWCPMSACLWKIPRNARKTNVLGKIAGCPRLTERVMGTLRHIGWSHVEVLGLMVSFCRVFAATVELLSWLEFLMSWPNTIAKSNLRREGFNSSYTSISQSIIEEAEIGTGSDWNRSHGGALLAALLPPVLPQFLFLYTQDDLPMGSTTLNVPEHVEHHSRKCAS